jgi:hypothetical protein
MIHYNEEHNIFLELDSRRSGKTTRLIRNVHDWLRSDHRHRAIIVCYNVQEKRQIEELLMRLGYFPMPIINVYTSERFFNVMNPLGLTNNVKLFFDEFGSYQEKFRMVYNNAYYSTTPNIPDRNNDFICNLIRYLGIREEIRIVQRSFRYIRPSEMEASSIEDEISEISYNTEQIEPYEWIFRTVITEAEQQRNIQYFSEFTPRDILDETEQHRRRFYEQLQRDEIEYYNRLTERRRRDFEISNEISIYEEIEQKKQKEIFVEDNDDEAYFNRIGLK